MFLTLTKYLSIIKQNEFSQEKKGTLRREKYRMDAFKALSESLPIHIEGERKKRG